MSEPPALPHGYEQGWGPSHNAFSLSRPKVEDAAVLPEPRKIGVEDLVEQLMQDIQDEPLVVRSFLSNLDDENKRVVHGAFKTSALKDVLGEMLGLKNIEPDNIPIENFEIKFAHVIRELSQYRKMVDLQLQQRFGFLNLLLPDELIRLLEHEEPVVKAAVLRFLPKETQRHLVRQFDEATKKALATSLLTSKSIDEQMLVEAEQHLRTKVDELEKSLFMPYTSADSLLDVLVEESDNQQDFVKTLFSGDKNRLDKYRSYAFGADDIFKLTPATLATTLERMPNDLLAKWLNQLDREQQGYMLKHLGDFRRKIVLSQMQSSQNSSDASQDFGKQAVRFFRESLQHGKGSYT